jgi:hypothetical protein
MDKKYFIFITISILLLSISSIDTAYAASLYGWSNLLGPVANQAFNTLTLGYGKIAYEDYKEGVFYPVAQWEIDVCVSKVTSDLQVGNVAGQLGDSTDLKDIYGPVTAAINAQKYSYKINESAKTLYQVGYYIQPRIGYPSIKYSIYLVGPSAKKYYPPQYANQTADPMQGATGNFIQYLNSTEYNRAGIESAGGVVIFENKIVENPFGVDYG